MGLVVSALLRTNVHNVFYEMQRFIPRDKPAGFHASNVDKIDELNEKCW